MLHIIIADNQDLTHLGMLYLIKEHSSDSVVDRVNSKKELVSKLLAFPRSIIILDYALFDFAQPSDLINISERFHESVWLVSSEDLQSGFIRQIVYGSSRIGLIFKESVEDEYRSAIYTSMRGERYICHHITELLLKRVDVDAASQSSVKLTNTESEIVRAMATGSSTKEIADRRNLSFHTVNTHRKNIFRKLQVNNVQEAVRKAISMGIIDMADYYI